MPRPKTDSIRVNVYLPAKHLSILKKLAARRATTYSELVRHAVDDYLIAERDRLRREAE